MSETPSIEPKHTVIEAPKKPSRFSFIYDRSVGTFFGRDCRSWTLILLFYAVYYACLAGFFMAMMQVFLRYTIMPERPSLTGDHNLLKLKPGLGVRPLIETQKTLIQFSRADRNTWMPYVVNLDAFLHPYRLIQTSGIDYRSHKACSTSFERDLNSLSAPASLVVVSPSELTDDVLLPGLDELQTESVSDPEVPCMFDLQQLKSCSADVNYGYPSGQPCVLLKINKVFGWLPRVDTATVRAENTTKPADQQAFQHPRVECTGSNPADRENIGKIRYFPDHNNTAGAFHNAFFPYLGQAGYLSPIVAVKFMDLQRNVVVMVTCKLHNAGHTTGVVKFELYMD